MPRPQTCAKPKRSGLGAHHSRVMAQVSDWPTAFGSHFTWIVDMGNLHVRVKWVPNLEFFDAAFCSLLHSR